MILRVQQAKGVFLILGILSIMLIIITFKNQELLLLPFKFASNLQYRFPSFEFKPSVEEILAQRRDTLHSACQRSKFNASLSEVMPKLNGMLKRRRWLVSDEHKLIYCVIPKCSCTNMKRFFVFANGLMTPEKAEEMENPDFHDFANKKMKLLKDRDFEEAYRKLDTYRKLVVVREPMGRLLSAYRQKLEKNTTGNEHYIRESQKIHAYFNPKERATATFDEFLKYTLTPRIQDVHWNLFNALCLPCTMKYDYIVHVETIAQDMEYVAKELGISNVTFPEGNAKTNSNILKEYYGKIDKELIDKVYEKYKIDYDIFGYERPDV